jgi:hypothetical protein
MSLTRSLPRSLLSLLVFAGLVFAQQEAWKNCFLPQGSQATNEQWAPCSSDSSNPLSNICCATNRTIPTGGRGKDEFQTADVCLDNGICMNRYLDDNGDYRRKFLRGYCTSDDFDSGKCLNICGKTVRNIALCSTRAKADIFRVPDGKRLRPVTERTTRLIGVVEITLTAAMSATKKEMVLNQYCSQTYFKPPLVPHFPRPRRVLQQAQLPARAPLRHRRPIQVTALPAMLT